ncbi:hook-length control protein FliK [Thalassolituus maritimus]|uniref:Hook-length control protein FliK n=1 Tax=Thalassolituus maritimus TaxID=484498 RepID=A0A1N7J804_9GAMM|nr:flagellar hook-length control protein FliK [Thalassolituus maritimus]SIS45397.1 hook-length control protein FliK [Thalassolituus maritimus]
MKTPDMPLIQSALTKAVRSETSGASAARSSSAASSGSAANSDVEFSATVTASRRTSEPPTSGRQTSADVTDSAKNNVRENGSRDRNPSSPNNWQITVTSQGKSLNLQSSHPLPVGAEVSLRVTEQTPPSVVITEIKLPQSQASPTSTNPASQASGNASLASQLQSMAQQLQLTAALQLARASNGITTSSAILQQNPTSASGAGATTSSTAALPDTMKALLMARAGWSQGSSLPTGSVATSSGQAPTQAASVSNGYSVGGSTGLRGPSVATTSTPDYSAVLRAVLNDLTSAGANRNSQSSLLQATESLVRNLPDAAQLSSPSGLHKAISNSPLNYESQLFRLAATPQGSASASGSGEPVSSPTNVASVFKALWSKASAHAGAPTSSTASSAANGASESLRQSISTDTSAITKPSLLSAIETLQKQLSSEGPANSETSAAQLAALLSSSSASSTASSALQSSPVIPGDNLKGLLLFILGRSQSNPASTSEGAAGSATMAAARSGAQTNPLAGALNEGLRPETFRLLQTALSQTESEQVRLVQTQDTTQYQVPLMWRDNDTVKQDLLCLKRDDDQSASEDGQKKQSRWQITLHFDLETLGPLDIELDLCPPAVSATFWSETSDTLSEIQQALRPLRENLTSLGADVGELRARHGRKLPGEQPVIRHSLVDIHT